MGNTSSEPSEGQGQGLDDLSCLEIKNSAIFNDAYASEMYASLPEYEGTETEDAPEEEDSQVTGHSVKMNRLMQVFGKPATSAPSVDDFADLKVSGQGATTAQSDFLNMVKVRARLMQRIHIAYSRRLSMSKGAGSAGSSEEKFLRLTRAGGVSFQSADALLTAASIKMSLSVMACLGPQHPGLFKDFADALMDLLSRSPSLALSQVLSDSPQGESVRAIVGHTGAVAARSEGPDRAHALSLLLALAVSSGSLGDLLQLAMLLKEGSETLPPSTAPFLARLNAMTTELKLSCPAPATIISDFRAKLSLDDADRDRADFCSTIAGDGVYLFVWDGTSRSIAKVGTGFHGTIAGNEYAVNCDIEAQLRDRLGAAVYGKVDKREGAGDGETEDPEVAVVAAAAAVPTAPTAARRLRMTGDGLMVTLEEDADLMQCFSNEDFEDTDMLCSGFEADIVSEHSIFYPGQEDESCMVYGIGDNRYVVSVEPIEDEDEDEEDDSDCCDSDNSNVVHFIPNLTIVESTGGAGGGRGGGATSARVSSGAYRPARIASANGRIYLWMSYLLGPFRVAVFSTSALKLEEIIDIALPIKELMKGRRSWLKTLALTHGDGAAAGAGEESKEEDSLQEEKWGGGDEDNEEEEDEEEDTDTILGLETVLCSPLVVGEGEGVGGASISRVSSAAGRQPDMQLLAAALLGSEFSQNVGPDEEAPFAFLRSDEDQFIVVDLGADFSPGSFGTKMGLCKLFEVSLSADNIQFFPYGQVEGFAPTGPALVTPPGEGGGAYAGPADIRYVKYSFGSGSAAAGNSDGSGDEDVAHKDFGTRVFKLFASGYKREKVIKELPSPVMCSDGRYLVFLSSKQVAKSEPDAKLRAITVDPLNGMRVVSDILFDYDVVQMDLENSSFASNGENLVMIHRAGFKPREKKEKDVEFNCIRFNLLTEKEDSSHTYTFSDKTGYPQAISYDSRNNCIWSWDSFESRVLRWRNAGYAPRFLPPRPASHADLLLSESPQYRLEALSSLAGAGGSGYSAAAAEAAKILCLVDRIADLHSPPLLPMAESKAYDQIEVASAGFEDGCYCRLSYRGQLVHESSRGFNIVLLNDQFEVLDHRTFDTHSSDSMASERMADFVETIEEGSVVMVGIMDSAKANLTTRGISALKTLGADRLEKLTTRGSFAMIGCKGCNANDARITQVMLNKKEGPAVVKQRIPSPKIPLAVDSSPATLKALVGLISTHYALFKGKTATDIDKVILLTCIRLCTTNVFHLLRGLPSEEVAAFLSAEEKASLITFVMELINDPPAEHGGVVIARAALRLFITAIDVLYATSGEKCSLLVQYLKEFVDGTLSVLEKAVLELLLRQMSNAVSLAKILSDNDPTLLVASLASIAEKETVSKMEVIAAADRGSNSGASSNGVGDASVDMLSTLCNMILSQGVDDFLSTGDVNNEVLAGVNKIVQLLIKISDISCSVIEKGIEANAAVSAASDAAEGVVSDGGAKTLDKEIDELMKNSPAGALLPIALFGVSRIASINGPKFVTCSDLASLSASLGACLSSVQKVLSRLSKKELMEKPMTDTSFSKTLSTVIESSHPYLSNEDRSWELSFPNAVRMTIVFDAESKTERNYDYVIIWKDASKQEKWHTADKFSGKSGQENFPGVGDKPPLVIEGNSAHVEFHSDGSNEEWGFRFTATAEMKPSAPTVQRHWAFDLERQLGYCGSRVAAAMVVGSAWNVPLESPYVNVVDDDMLQGEFRKEIKEIPANMRLLFDLAHGRADPATLAFCKTMKSKVMEDRGQVEDINCAVYATAAVLIKFNGLAAEAQAISDGTRDIAPSDALLKVWKSSQKMRHYFDLSDLKAVQNADSALPPLPSSGGGVAVLDDDGEPPPPIGLTRGPSLYSGAGADIKKNASDCVVARCRFLLRIDDSVSGGGSDDFDEELGEPPAAVASVNPSAGKKMWQLLSKGTTKLVPKMHRDVSVENKWHNVVGAAQFANQLKDLISYRRMAAQRKGGTASITERVLKFVQSNASVTQLEGVRALKNDRAKLRASGLQLVNHLIGSRASPFCVSLLASSVQGAFRAALPPESPVLRAHYLNSIEGCSPTMCGEVIGHFSNFVRGCTAYILSAYERFTADADDKLLQKSVLLTCLKSLAFDYDTSTHNILLKAGVVSMIGTLTKSPDKDIRSTAWSLYELLLLRCSGMNSLKEIPDEPSDFTANAVSFLIAELEKTAALLPPPPSQADSGVSNFDITVCPKESREIKPDSLGFTFPHVPLGLESTVSLWVRRQPGAREGQGLLSADCVPEPNMRVIRGPDWDPLCRDDGPKVFNRGTIVKVDDAEVSVVWDNTKPTKTYKYGKLVDPDGAKVFEVSIIDESVGGHIFSKGSPAVFDNGEDIKWSNFGLSMLPDSRLCFVAANGEDNWFTHSTKSKVCAGEWTCVTIVHKTAKHLMYVNGELDSEVTVPSSLLYPEENAKDFHIVESAHPYADDSDSYTVVDVEGCLGYTITFDEQSKTELTYDYIRFYKDDNHGEYWGEDKYHGGRGSSSRNFPGVNGRPPLHIPAGRFVIHFKSDGSNNEWGYKIYCAMEMPTKEDDARVKYTNLNNLPLYIGQTPAYVTNIESPSSLDGDIFSMGIFPRSLSGAEVMALKVATERVGSANAPRLDETLCLNLISMLHRSCVMPGAPVSAALSCPAVVLSALKMVARGPHLVAVSALRFCGTLLPTTEPDVVDVQANKAGLCELAPGCFIDYLLVALGSTFNSWQRFLPPDSRPTTMTQCGAASFGVGWECVLLFHSLLSSPRWSTLIMERIANVMEKTIPTTLEALLSISRQEAAKPTGDLGKFIHIPARDLNMSFGVLGILCGAPDGLNVGAKARCSVGEGDGILEECTVLSPTYPATTDDPLKTLEPKTFGNAMVLVLDSQPMEYLVVDRRNIFPVNRSVNEVVEGFLKAEEGRLQALFTLFVRSDCSDHRPVLKPKVVESDKKIVVESKHPYAPNLNNFEEVCLKGAKALRIEFDPQCRTVNDDDFLRFYKDSTHVEHYGESKYYGKDSSQNWLRDKPPLVINADKFVLHFHSSINPSPKDWGYKLTVSGHCVEKTAPPMLPPLIHLAVASDLKAYALKSLDFLLRNCAWFIKPVVPLIRDLAFSAMTPSPQFDVSAGSSKPLLIESPHPYENSANSYVPYCIKGAKRLIISFDPQTRTESGCDYLKFYKDSSQSEVWGEQYTGGKDNGSSNWPGMNGRPPLIIPADGFVLHFHTDSSVNDWGYKFTVSVEGGRGVRDDLDKLTASDRSYQHNCIQQFLLEGPARMPYPANASQFAAGAAPRNPLLLDAAAISLLCPPAAGAPPAVDGAARAVTRYAMPRPSRKKANRDDDVLIGPMLCNADLRLNRDNTPCVSSMDSQHTNEMRHYCARNVGRGSYNPTYNQGCCDGQCGPTNGCQCPACFALDESGPASQPTPVRPDGVTRPADACPNMHPLKLLTRRGGWSCDGRSEPQGCKSGHGGKNEFVKNGSRWRCDHCDFDYCGLCLAARMVPSSPSAQKRMASAPVDQYFITLPADFYVNGADCKELIIYESKSTESSMVWVVGTWESVSASAEDGDWLRVSTASNQSGWAQRRSRDLIYLLPECDIEESGDSGSSGDGASSAVATSQNDGDLVTIEVEGGEEAVTQGASSSAPGKHPMYEVLDDVVAKAGAKKTILPQTSDVLKGRSGYIENAAMMASTVSSIGYAKSSVTTCLSNWPMDFPFSIDYFGGETLFLSYIRAAFMAQDEDSGGGSGVADKSDLYAVKARILDLVRAENKSGADTTCSMLINFALRQLNDSLKMGTSLRPTKAVVKQLESIHPYNDNMDEWYDLSIPGAKWLKIVFDKQSSLEKDCDYLEVYKDRSKAAKWGSVRYTGRANAPGRVFAGVNATPPLVVKSDNCSIFFHTDSSNTDWGWKLTCYGIMEEPTEEELAAHEERETAADRPRPDMAYWLLDFLAMEQSPMAQQVLFSPSTIKTLRQVMDFVPNNEKTPVINLITNMLQTITRVDISADCKSELETFRTSVVSLAESLHNDGVKGRSGATGEVSQVLQAIMQAVIVFDTALASVAQKMSEGDSESPSEAAAVSKYPVVPCFKSEQVPGELRWAAATGAAQGGGVVVSDGGLAVRRADDGLDIVPSAAAAGSPPSSKSMFSKISGGFNMGSGGKGKDGKAVPPVPAPAFGSTAVTEGVAAKTVLAESGFSTSFSFSLRLDPADASGSVGIAAAGVSSDESLGWYVAPSPSDPPAPPPSAEAVSIGWSGQRLCMSGREDVAFGPAVRSGDIVSVDVDVGAQTVSFYRNFAYVGLAVGPPGSGAAIETATGIFGGNSPSVKYYPAVTLVEKSSRVEFVAAPAALHETAGGNPAVGRADSSPDWIAAYLETANMLQACTSRDVPQGMLLTTFLPQCQEAKTVTVESAHPFSCVSASGRVEDIRIPGAQKLIVYIDPATKMNASDVIEISGSGVGEDVSPSNVEFVGMEGGTDSCLLNESICPGDRVVRGPNWTWGGQDGGAGNIGTVTNVLAWKGVTGAAVEVQWDIESKFLTPFTGLYRWGYERKHDVICLSRGVGKRPLVFGGDSVRVQIRGDKKKPGVAGEEATAEEEATPWGGCQYFDGSSLLRLDTVDELELGGDFTIECWVHPEAGAGFAPLLSRQIEMDTRLNQLSVALVQTDGNLTVELSMLNAQLESYCLLSGGIVPVKAWSHIAVTLAGNTQTIYVDGVVVASSSSVSGERTPSMGAALIVGANEGGQSYKGHIYDLRVFNIGRSSEDILREKNTPMKPNSPMILSLLMDEDLMNAGDPNSPHFDPTVIQPVLPDGTIFGYKITVRPVFSLEQVTSSEEFKPALDALVQKYSLGSLRHDVMLVKYLNQVMRDKKVGLEKILSCAWSEVAPSEEELSRWPVLKELCNITEHSNRNTPAAPSPMAGAKKPEVAAAGDTAGAANTTVESRSDMERLLMGEALDDEPSAAVEVAVAAVTVSSGPDPLEVRFQLVQLLNKKLEDSMQYIDLCMGNKPWSIAYRLLQCRGVVLEAVKLPFWDTALDASSVSGGQFDLRLSRSRAIKHARTGLPDHDGRFMTFSQAFRAIHANNPSTLRRSGQLYNTILLGEFAQDVGGPYRESFAQYCAELQSTSLPLFERTPNGRQSAGQNREMWVLNPGATSLTHMEMFAFLGKLMGIAIRGKEYLALNMAPFIWKLLVRDEPTIEDLEGIDYHQVKVLKEIRHSELSPEIFSMAYEDIGFTCVSTDDRTVNLVPDGHSVQLTYENRMEYCNLLENYRLHEFDEQAEAIRRGLATIVPMRLMSLFTWDQLEMMVCGESTVNIALLRSVAEYSSCSSNDAHIRNFWQVLEEFTEEEKAAFLKFTWGRSRLPLNAAAFAQRFKLQSFGKSPADTYLPVSHTCFFSLELPRYSTIDVMRDRLRYAITHCLAIDGDDTSIGIQAAAMGWEE
jgi:hypothetical protein